MAEVFEIAKAHFCPPWSERVTRCVLAVGLDVRFEYRVDRWSVRPIPARYFPVRWQWSRAWNRWVIVGLEDEALRGFECELHELANVRERFEGAYRQPRREREGDA